MPLTPIQEAARAGLLEKLTSGTYRLETVPECPCGSSGLVPVADRDRFGIPVGVVVCRRCGLARTSPRLASADLAAFYEYDYHALHQGVVDPDPATALFRIGQGTAIAAMLDQLLSPGPLRVADVGCGTGQVLREFVTAMGRPATAAGCEYASAFVAAGRAAGSDIRQGGPEVLMDLAPFDVVILSHVVEHLPDPVGDMRAVRALGQAETLFYVEVPGILRIDHRPEYAYGLEQYVTLAHTFHFSLATLTETMQRAGFARVLGDEEVRSAFRHAPAAEPDVSPDNATRILDSLAALRSRRMRLRRLPRVARQRMRVVAVRVLPVGAYARLRRLARRR